MRALLLGTKPVLAKKEEVRELLCVKVVLRPYKSSHRKWKAMEQHVIKRARKARAEEVDEDHSLVDEASQKELMLARVKDRESDSE
ncbi:hypothetical protein Syun_027809 [Stephania yunnanensis]|uniref:Uncharacterized protein n=1 Tax=Stephania yunnanensis TaxID=152371 RepID=A0AAP0ELR6_9MAGN